MEHAFLAHLPYLELRAVFTNRALGLRAEVYRDYSVKMTEDGPVYRTILRDMDADKTVGVVWNDCSKSFALAESFVDK